MGLLDDNREKKRKEIKTKYKPPPTYKKQTDSNEDNLNKLNSREINIYDPALGLLFNYNFFQ